MPTRKNRADESKYGIHVPAEIDVKAIRIKMSLSQNQFARRFSFTPAQIRDWEQGRLKPDGAARGYLMAIAKEPKAVARALKASWGFDPRLCERGDMRLIHSSGTRRGSEAVLLKVLGQSICVFLNGNCRKN